MSVLSTPFGKGTIYKLNPSDIKLPDHMFQGRFDAKPKNVEEMANSLLADGQKQNIIVRKNNENAPVLVFGYRRRAAALMINEKRHDKNFRASLSPEALVVLDKLGEEPFRLEVKIEDIGEQKAFLDNVAENVKRVDLSPMDRMKIILVMRNNFNMKDDEIAAVFNKKPWYVYHHLKLASLSKRIQELVDIGIISLEVAAKTLVKVPESERETMVDSIVAEYKAQQSENELTAEDGNIDKDALTKITGAILARAERARRQEAGESTGAIKRTLADQKKFIRNYIDQHPVEKDPVSALLADLMAFNEGAIQESALVKRLKKHLGIESAKKTAAASSATA